MNFLESLQTRTQEQFDHYHHLGSPVSKLESGDSLSVFKDNLLQELHFQSTLSVSTNAFGKEPVDAEIPLIDLEFLEQAEGFKRSELLQKLGDGLKDVGFIAVKADSLNVLIERVNVEMASYFHQSFEEKMKDWRNNNGQTGFSEQGRETASGASKADIKETFFISPNFEEWPKNRPEFENTMKKYHIELSTYASKLMGFIAEYLGEETENISISMKAACNLLRLAYYPALRPSDEPGAVWSAAHEDLNAFTLLPPSEIPGLELLSKKGEWLRVNAPKGYLIVNTGEQLQYKTAGMIKATTHRVINPGGKYQRSERFASIFFASWSNSFSLKPFASCLSQMTFGMSAEEKISYAKQFPDVSVDDSLISRLIEMQTIKNPSEEMLRDLRKKGLLQNPPKNLIEKYPMIFA